MYRDNRSAILFFSRDVREEIQAKTISDGHRIIPFLINRSRKVAWSTGLPVFESNRMNLSCLPVPYQFFQALKKVFDEGFEKVIVIGNDCPQLQAKDILEADSLLENNELVLGPDSRGGAYLFALHKNSFREDWISALPWHSHDFLLAASGSVRKTAYLVPLEDINTTREIRITFRKGIRKHLLYALIRLLSQVPDCSPQGLRMPGKAWRAGWFFRGPPRCVPC